ncbi:DUF7575 domain-containing protein [Natronorubrum halalkaliphilum]|uniref:DUF7575 domain-containing protein n=1 Tax=Natronorubrum halalkaliphilum TaxID=2691917 RepID=UPI003CCC265C
MAHTHNVHLEVQEDWRCSSCYRELEDDLSFCSWCGAELPEPIDEATDPGDDAAEPNETADR